MSDDRALRLFGSELRTKILLFLRMLEESYSGELALLIGVSRVTVYRALDDLEKEGYVTSALGGRERWVRLNPRHAAHRPLSDLLETLAESRPEIVSTLSQLRRRPRRRGKPIAR